MTTKRAAIYTRVSSDRQELDGSSLDTQVAACRSYAAEHGYTVTGEYSDTHTGAEYRERPGLGKLREILRADGIDVVIAYALDRLSRNQAHLYILAEEIEDHGARLEFVSEDFEDSAVGRFIRSAKAFAAEVEREKIAERSTRGRRDRVASGKILPGPRALYGYQWRDADKTALDIDPVTGPVVQRIYRECVSGKTIRAIGRGLTADGIPTPTGKVNWSPESLSQILHHPNYTGDAYAWAWRPTKEHHYRVFDPETAIALPEGTIPALIDRDVWEAVQAQLARNKRMARRNNRNPEASLLRSGFVFCGHCGRAMVVKPSGKSRGYNYLNYVCGGRGWRAESCEMPSIATHKLDTATWERVTQILTDPEIVAAELERLQQGDGTGRELASVDRSLREIERRRGNLARAIAELRGGEASAPLIAELERLGEHATSLQRERREIETQQDTRQRALARLGDLTKWCHDIAARLDTLDYEQKRMALVALGIEVKVYSAKHEPRYTITARLPLDEDIASSTSRS